VALAPQTRALPVVDVVLKVGLINLGKARLIVLCPQRFLCDPCSMLTLFSDLVTI
jgi:hypothetical protein